MIETLAEQPILLAPALNILKTSSRVWIPPEALTPIFGPTAFRIIKTSRGSAPLGPKPVEVLTKSAPAF